MCFGEISTGNNEIIFGKKNSEVISEGRFIWFQINSIHGEIPGGTIGETLRKAPRRISK